MRRNDALTWADMAVVMRAMLRLAESVSPAGTPRPPPSQWPTQRARQEVREVRRAAPWPTKRLREEEEGNAAQEVPASLDSTSGVSAPEPAPGVELQRQLATEAQTAPEALLSPSASAPVPAHSASAPAPQNPALSASAAVDEYDAANERTKPLHATRVPSTRLGRLLHYGSLGAGLAWGSASEYMRRSSGSGGSLFLSERNVERLVDKLSTMRGAALKLGQFLSIQDSHLLPPQVEQVLLRVQNSANYMPSWQLEKVMNEELGPEWRLNFASFDERPFAAASIGQVHSAILADPFPAQPSMAGKRVAVKVQFPGVKDSIKSDLSYIKWLLTASSLLPKGLFLENSVQQLQQELHDECDYTREAEMCRRFYEHVSKTPPSLGNGKLHFEVPQVVDSLSKPRVLTLEFMRGRPLTQVSDMDQATRDAIATAIMELSLRELFDWHLMQTDPNWSNFLYHAERKAIQLIDFGATRPYTPDFIAMWLGLLRAAVSGDRTLCERWSIDIGYLNGDEPETMRNAHVTSMLTLGEPFRHDAPVPYAFADQTITDRVREQIPIMVRERHRPPPRETYSLNRKLSGAFLLCARLRANVNCRDLFAQVTQPYAVQTPRAEFRGTQNTPGTKAPFHTHARRFNMCA